LISGNGGLELVRRCDERGPEIVRRCDERRRLYHPVPVNEEPQEYTQS
jgi:hypothetical protein